MRHLLRSRAAFALFLGVSAVPALCQAPLIHHPFEENEAGWVSFGGGKVSLTHEAAFVKEGKGALKFDYEVTKGTVHALALPTGDGALAKMKAMRFWMKCDYATMFVVSLQEMGGGRYSTLINIPADKWQLVELAPSDFILGEEPNDPKDPDGKLDLDQVESFTFLDFKTMMVQAEDSPLAKLFAVKPGPHALYLDEFSVTEEKLPGIAADVKTGVVLDSFLRPQIAWIGVGGVALRHISGKPLDGMGLEAKYTRTANAFCAVARSVRKGSLTGCKTLSFDIACTEATSLVFQVEEVGGGKYKTVVEVPAGGAAKHFDLKFAEFTAADDSHDTNDKLDLDQVKQLVIIDFTGLAGAADQANTLTIGNLRAK